MKNIIVFLSLVVALGLAMPAPAVGYDRTESDDCVDCHYPDVPLAAEALMHFVVATWLDSGHASSNNGFNENTYCAVCHAPFQADPNATELVNVPVPLAVWEAVTCGACHPPIDERIEWGTPIGTFDVGTQTWSPVYEENANDLCTYCHVVGSGQMQIDFHTYGNLMFNKKGVRCIDCHMPKIPMTGDNTDRRTHDLDVGPNLPYSCITAQCHANKTEEWAAKKIAKNKFHGKTK